MKLELHKAYKTRGGWRAVVVNTCEDGRFLVWHEEDYDSWYHEPDGRFDAYERPDYGLIEEWKEPEVFEDDVLKEENVK